MSATQSAVFLKDRKLQVFLCHASADKPTVRNLYRRLKQDGFAPWLDEEELLPGQHWQQEIPEAVRSADVVIVCLSKISSTKEGYVQREIKFALDVAEEKPPGTIFIIPACLEEGLTIPQRLRELQWVNLFQDDGYQRLIRALDSRAKTIEWYQRAADAANEDAPNQDAARAARRAEQLQAIAAVALQTTAVLDLDELLVVVSRLLLEWFNYIDHAAVLLCEGEALRVRAHEGRLTPKVPLGALLPPGAGLAARALSQGKSIICDQVNGAEGYFGGFEETQSEMCIPLIFFGEKLGVLALDSAVKGVFDPDDVQPLESIADICAAAIQNASYFARMRQLAYTDHLTAIHNRRYFEMRMVEEIERAERFQGRMSLLMVDVDHFRRLNDELGHLIGDEVLGVVAGLIKQQLRKVDTVCRYGGEEFAVIVPETTGENGVMVAEKLRRQVETHPFPGVPRPVTISCGVADYPTRGRTRDELVGAADAALQVAQQAGRNRVYLARS